MHSSESTSMGEAVTSKSSTFLSNRMSKSRWQVLGPMSEEQASPERAQIIAVLARAGKPMTTKEISEAVGGKYPNIKQLLSKLHFDGQVERITTGLYKLPEPQQGLNLGEPP